MAVLFFDGFENLATSMSLKYDTGSGATWTNSNPRTGTGAARMLSTNYLTKNITFGSSTIIIGVGVRLASTTSAGSVISINEGATAHLRIATGTSYAISVANGSGTVLAGPVTLLPDVWYYMELKAVIHDTTGSFEFRIDDAVIGSGTNVDTRNGGTGVPNAIRIAGSGGTKEYDDFYVADDTGTINNDFLSSAVKITAMVPNAAGDSTDWTPLTGSNWDNVDDTLNSGAPTDTSYNSTSTSGHIDLYNIGAMSGTPSRIAAVQVAVVARKDDAGTREIKAVIQGSTDTTRVKSAAFPLTTSYTSNCTVISEVDPSTGLEWTVDGVNAMQAGVENV